MADTKVTGYPNYTTPIASDIMYIVEAAGPSSKSVTVGNLGFGITNVYNVKNYGATGDGFTDDTASIQATIDAAKVTGGGKIFFPHGTYLVSETSAVPISYALTIESDNITLEGEGDGSAIICADTTRIFVIYGSAKPDGIANFDDHDYVYARRATLRDYYVFDPAIKGDSSITTTTHGDAVNFSAGDYVYILTGQTLAGSADESPDAEINEVLSANAGTGVVTLKYPLSKSYAQEYYIVGVDGVTSTSPTANPAPFGISNANTVVTSGIEIKNLRFIQNGALPVIDASSVERLNINHCSFEYALACISMNFCRNVITSSNHLHKLTGGSPNFSWNLGWGTGCTDIACTNNTLTGQAHHYLHIHEGCANVRVIGNIISMPPNASGVYCLGVGARAYQVVISNNVIINGGTSYGIHIASDVVDPGIVTGNVVIGQNITTAIERNTYFVYADNLELIGTITDAIYLTSNLTNDTEKHGFILGNHYSNSEQPIQIFSYTTTAGGDNNIYIGGANAAYNAATQIKFYTAANNITLTGTLRLTIDYLGDFNYAEGVNMAFGTTTGTMIGTAAAQKIGFYGHAPAIQQTKAGHNNWANVSDIAEALAAIGLIDSA